MSRKIIAFCVAILLLLTCSYSVYADEFDPGRTGYLTITLTEQNEPIVGAELSVYYVAAALLDEEGRVLYDYTKDFEGVNTPLGDAQLATKLDAFVSQKNVPSVKIVTDENGKAVCDDLQLGLYFIKQTVTVDGFAPCTPFVVTVPGEKDGEYVYDVDASPKTEVERLTSITVKKVWNTNASAKAADSVTVQLLKNGTVVKTAILNSQNNWQITYTNMPKSDAYSIKEVNIPKGFTATYKQEENVFTVTNSSTLIQTGQLLWPIPVLAGSGMLLLALGIVLLQKKRKNNA